VSAWVRHGDGTTGPPSRGIAIPLERAPGPTQAVDGRIDSAPFTALLASSTTSYSARSDHVIGIPVSNPSE